MKIKKMLLGSVLALVIVLVLLIFLSANSPALLWEGMTVKIIFDPGYGVAFEQELTPEESARVIEILKGGYTESLFGSTPACGFSPDVAIEAGLFRFLPAMDTCNWLGCGSTLCMLNVTTEEMAEIHAIFEKYGGHFPCI